MACLLLKCLKPLTVPEETAGSQNSVTGPLCNTSPLPFSYFVKARHMAPLSPPPNYCQFPTLLGMYSLCLPVSWSFSDCIQSWGSYPSALFEFHHCATSPSLCPHVTHLFWGLYLNLSRVNPFYLWLEEWCLVTWPFLYSTYRVWAVAPSGSALLIVSG